MPLVGLQSLQPISKDNGHTHQECSFSWHWRLQTHYMHNSSHFWLQQYMLSCYCTAVTSSCKSTTQYEWDDRGKVSSYNISNGFFSTPGCSTPVPPRPDERALVGLTDVVFEYYNEIIKEIGNSNSWTTVLCFVNTAKLWINKYTIDWLSLVLMPFLSKVPSITSPLGCPCSQKPPITTSLPCCVLKPLFYKSNVVMC